jgi:transglutaminase-like putative cysteine protease
MLRIRSILNLLLYSAAIIGYLPLAPYLQMFPRLALPAAVIYAAIADRHGRELKGRAALLVSISGFMFYFLQFSRHNLVEPAANMLAIFLAIRVAGEKSPRNYLQTLTLALFCLAASTLFDLSPGFVLYLVLLLLAFTVSMVLLTFESNAAHFAPDKKDLRAIISVALLHPLVAAPLVLLLFFILPRTQLPLWNGLSRAGIDKSGVSETIKAGEKSSISSGNSVVFRAEMPQQPLNTLYWRAIVLNTVKGDEWLRQTPPAEKSAVSVGDELSVTIFLEPGRLHYLPTLTMPVKIPEYRGVPQDDQIYPARGLGRGKRSYQVLASRGGHLAIKEGFNEKFYAATPENTPPRLKRLVAASVAGLKNDEDKVAALENLFAGMGLAYSPTGLPTGADALEKFLFSGKKGHCELFAVSFATAMRLAGLPARLVGGYYGGDYNAMAGYYIISEEMAHVWVEVWLSGKGWIMLDPSRFAVNYAESFTEKRSGYDLRLRLFLDSLAYHWNRLVINYDFESQLSAVSRAGAELQGLKTVKFEGRTIVKAIAGLLLLVGSILFFTMKRLSPEEQLLKKFKRIMLRKYDIDIPASSGLHEAVKSIDNPAVQEFVDRYCETLYRDRTQRRDERAALEQLLTEIKRC